MANTKKATIKPTIKPVEPKEEKRIPATMKIKMVATYISNEMILRDGNVYDVPTKMAMELLKNGECIEC